MPVDNRAARLAGRLQPASRRKSPKAPLTVERIVDVALAIVAAEGFDALTMRRVAAELDTGPASLYAHVVNKADLDELLIGRLCQRIVLPEPDPASWRERILDLSVQLRDAYLEYPGLSRAALGVVPTNPDTLRISEGMLSILLAGGVPAQTASWAIDALSLYVSAYCLEQSLWVAQLGGDEQGWVLTQQELRAKFDALPSDAFPNTKRYAAELTAGEGHVRFDFAMRAMIAGLEAAEAVSEKGPSHPSRRRPK